MKEYIYNHFYFNKKIEFTEYADNIENKAVLVIRTIFKEVYFIEINEKEDRKRKFEITCLHSDREICGKIFADNIEDLDKKLDCWVEFYIN